MMELLERVETILHQAEIRTVRKDNQVSTRIMCGAVGARLKVLEEQNVLKLLILTGLYAPQNRRGALADAVCRANFGLAMGCWELDMGDGEIRFRNSAPARDTGITDEMLKHLLFGSWRIAEWYTVALLEVLAGADPETAISKAEADWQQDAVTLLTRQMPQIGELRRRMGKQENVYDGKGKKIGEIHHETDRNNYYDRAGRFLGHTDKHGTRDRIGRIVADKPVGGLLWEEE